MPSFAAVPTDAVLAFHEISKGAALLFVTYCRHRDHDTGLCNPSLDTLAADLRCSYHQASRLRTELAAEGWIEPDPENGRDAVTLLKGAHQFPKQTVESLRKSAKTICGKAQKDDPVFAEKRKESEAEFAEKRKGFCGKAQKVDRSPITEQIEREAAAATAPVESFSDDGEPVDEAFFVRMKATGVKPETVVEQLAETFRYKLATGQEATRGMFRSWLRWEELRPAKQQGLFGAPVAEGAFTPKTKDAPAKTCDHTCPRCQGSGWMNPDGRGARRCSDDPNGSGVERREATG